MNYLMEVYLTGKDAEAKGLYNLNTGNLTVFKGSKITQDIVNSLKNHIYYRIRKETEDDNNVIENNVFLVDKVYESSSAAGAVVLGRSVNGPESWKTKEGLSIRTIENRKKFIDYLKENSIGEKQKEYIDICENRIMEFNQKFPFSKLKDMSLEVYDKLGSRDTFMYNIEKGTNDFLSGHLGNNRNKLFFQEKQGNYESANLITNKNPELSVEERFEIYKDDMYNSINNFNEEDYLQNSDSYSMRGANVIFIKMLSFYKPKSVLLLASIRIFKEIFKYLDLKLDQDDAVRANLLLKRFIYKYINKDTNIYALSKSLWNYYKDNIEVIEENNKLEEGLAMINLSEIFIEDTKIEEILNILDRKKNLIFQGVPGVGKTFSIKKILKSKYEINEDNYTMIQFHQSYSYEEFIEGLRPQMDGSYSIEDGVFKQFVKKAKSNPNESYFLIIDEINRGNMSKIFGELLMLIENDKRDKEKVVLPYSKEEFTIPSNLFIIGTMNTADRSLSLVDYALRRRFSFITLKPSFNTNKFENYMIDVLNYSEEEVNDINKIMNTINEKIISKLGENFVIGHSYFVTKNENIEFNLFLKQIFRYEILPTIEEYFFDDEDTINELKSDMGI